MEYSSEEIKELQNSDWAIGNTKTPFLEELENALTKEQIIKVLELFNAYCHGCWWSKNEYCHCQDDS